MELLKTKYLQDNLLLCLHEISTIHLEFKKNNKINV